MKTCKDCLHYKACFATLETCGIYEFNARFGEIGSILCQKCEFFTDRSEWIHLPCKVGNSYYMIKQFCTYGGDYEHRLFSVSDCEICSKECDKTSEIVEYKFKSAEQVLEYKPLFGRIIFLTREEAEKTLGRIKENDRNKTQCAAKISREDER